MSSRHRPSRTAGTPLERRSPSRAWALVARGLGSAAIVASLSAVAAAQPPSPEEKRRTELFLEARKLTDEGRFAEAVDPLREVLRIRTAPKALLALALVERELAHLVEARELLEQAIEHAKSAGLSDDEANARAALAELLPTIPRVDLEEADRFEGLQVFVDDQPAVLLDGRILVDPGNRAIRLEAPGYPPQREKVLALVGRSTTIYVGLDKQPSRADASGGSDRLLPPYVGPAILGGTGVVAMGVGLTLMALGSSDQSDARELCGGRTTGCPSSARPLAESGADKIIAGDVVFAVGGAFLIGGAVWLGFEIFGDDDERAAWSPRPDGFVVRF